MPAREKSQLWWSMCGRTTHPINWEVTSVLGGARGQGELLLKEALHKQMTPVEERFNQDRGQEILDCWTVLMRRQEGRSNRH